MISRLLVAVDGSSRAHGVFSAATELASRFGSAIYLFRAIFVPPEIPAAAPGSHADPLPEYLHKQAVAELDALAARVADVTVSARIVKNGQAWRLILDVSDEVDADLIVLGSHGYHGWDRVLGTTAARVVNFARRNVLVVHDRTNHTIP